ncbi:MAG: DUF4403 family protein [Nitrospira sp.]|nr:DUF4403 family protein [Nitrospira sp.]
MLPPSIRKALIVLSVTVTLTGCLAKQYVVRPPAPTLLPETPNPLSSPTESSVSFPVQVDLSPFIHAANDDSVIPKKFDHWRNSIKHPKGVEYRYYAERDDFAVAPSGSPQAISTNSGTMLRDWWKGIEPLSSSLSISTALRYKIGAHPLQCGDGTEWPKRATLIGNLIVGMTPSYGVSASVTGVTLNAIDPCKISITDTDVLQEVKNQLTERVQGGLSNAIARVNTLTARSRVEDVWHTLRNPIPLEPDAWLLFNIGTVWRSGFSSGGTDLIDDTIHITAKPVLVFGAEPPPAGEALPQLETEPASTGFHGAADAQLYGTLPKTLANRLASTGFHVVADIPLDYPSLSRSLAKRLQGKRVAVKGDFIQIADAAILGRGGNQVVLRITFEGDATGHLYFVGKPEMNTLAHSVQIGGLRLDLDSEQLLVKSGPDWLARSTIRELVMSEAVLGVSPASDRMRDLVTKALNRELSPTITTNGTVTSVQGIGVFADVNALYVRVMSDGSLNLKVDGKQ